MAWRVSFSYSINCRRRHATCTHCKVCLVKIYLRALSDIFTRTQHKCSGWDKAMTTITHPSAFFRSGFSSCNFIHLFAVFFPPVCHHSLAKGVKVLLQLKQIYNVFVYLLSLKRRKCQCISTSSEITFLAQDTNQRASVLTPLSFLSHC